MHGWPGTPLEEPTALTRPSSSIKGLTSKGEGREGDGRWSGEELVPPHFLGESYAL